MPITYIEKLRETRNKALELETKITPILKQIYEQTEEIMRHVFQKLNEQASNPYLTQIEFSLDTYKGNSYKYLYLLLREIYEQKELKEILLNERIIGIILDIQTFKEIFYQPEKEYIAFNLSSNTKNLSNDNDNYIVFIYLETLKEKAKLEGINIDSLSDRKAIGVLTGLRFYAELPTINSNVKLSLMKN